MISFKVMSIPVGQPRQRHRVFAGPAGVVVHNYTPSKHPVNAFKATLRLAYRDAANGQEPLQGPVGLKVVFWMPRPARMIWKKRPMPSEWHSSKPDVDNMLKAVADALSGLAWRDDSQVCRIVAEKKYVAGLGAPMVEIEIVEETT